MILTYTRYRFPFSTCKLAEKELYPLVQAGKPEVWEEWQQSTLRSMKATFWENEGFILKFFLLSVSISPLLAIDFVQDTWILFNGIGLFVLMAPFAFLKFVLSFISYRGSLSNFKNWTDEKKIKMMKSNSWDDYISPGPDPQYFKRSDGLEKIKIPNLSNINKKGS